MSADRTRLSTGQVPNQTQHRLGNFCWVKLLVYCIDKSVLVENRPLVKFIRNYIRDSSAVFSISSLVRISMTSFPAFTLLFVQKYSCLYNKNKITRRLEDMNSIFVAPPCNILYIYLFKVLLPKLIVAKEPLIASVKQGNLITY